MNPDRDIPVYEEIFPKPSKKETEPEEEPNLKVIPKPKTILPTFEFKEPPTLNNLNKIIQP